MQPIFAEQILYSNQNVLTKHPILMFLPFHAHLIRSWNTWHLRPKDLTLGSITLNPPVRKCQEFRTGGSSILSVSVKCFGKNCVFPHFSPISQFSGVWCKYWTIWEIRIDEMRYRIQKRADFEVSALMNWINLMVGCAMLLFRPVCLSVSIWNAVWHYYARCKERIIISALKVMNGERR